MLDKSKSIRLRKEKKGAIRTHTTFDVNNNLDLGVMYSPGVGEASKMVEADPKAARQMTIKSNSVMVITNGTAVLGYGDIGSLAGLPVVEAKAALQQRFANVDAFPICIDSKDVDEIVHTIKLISGSFGAVHLEDVKAPECFEIMEKLKEELDIPVYHDDQDGTAVVVLSALYNALKLVGKQIQKSRIVINGAGASGIATARLLWAAGAKSIILCDVNGIVSAENEMTYSNIYQKEIAEVVNPNHQTGTLESAIKNADVFIGLSVGGCVSQDMIKSMADHPIVFALANPEPEIEPKLAKEAGAAIVATGSSLFPNQVNNLLVFPGLFRGVLDSQIDKVDQPLLLNISRTIANLVTEEELTEEDIIPSVFHPELVESVSQCILDYAESVNMGIY